MSNDDICDIRSVTKRFGERVIFSDVSLTVHRSEVVAIVGPSGAGKSTLIRCVNHLTPFERGTISVLEHELRGTEEPGPKVARSELRQLRTEVGMVFQTFNLFPHLTVLENVMLGPTEVLHLSKREANERARDLLDTMNLTKRADTYPRRMSGGEQQRVAICRALAMEPKMMLFDEPTSMLDPELVGEVLDAIQRLVEGGMTTMLVTHEMQFAREVADKVAVMADGQLVEVGPAEQVLTAPKSDRARSFLDRVLRHGATGPGTGAGTGAGGPGGPGPGGPGPGRGAEPIGSGEAG